MDLDLECHSIDLPKRVLVDGMAAEVVVVGALMLAVELDQYSYYSPLESQMLLKPTLT